MFHSDTQLIVAIITKGYRIWEQSTVSHPKIFFDFQSGQHKFSPNVLIWSKYISIMETTRMIAFYWNVYCIGILLCLHAYDVMFMGCNAHLGTQMNYVSATSHGTRVCSNVETGIPFTCHTSGLINFEHFLVLLFCRWLHNMLRKEKYINQMSSIWYIADSYTRWTTTFKLA